MKIQLINGYWQTHDGKQWKDLDAVEKLLFDVMLAVEKIGAKYNLKFSR
jgi:hypothetical protein